MNPLDYETDEALAEQEKLGLASESAAGTHSRCFPVQHHCQKLNFAGGADACEPSSLELGSDAAALM
jgi:hypothetical protein